jgi:hypothetical protein
MRSIWRAHYELLDEQDQLLATVREENPMAKVADSFLGEVPLLGMFSGYLFHPKYLMTASNGQPMLRLTKQPAMFEGRYTVEKLSEFDPVDELRSLMGLLMMTLLERNRG